jgi:DNA-binding response OmpR family regulator
MTSSTTRSTPTVLLADDEPLITCVVAQKLQSAGYAVVIARDGEEAFELACSSGACMVVTDLQMPRMSGFELAQKLKAHGPTSTIPVIMLTARGYILEPNELATTNIKHLLGKPFSPREVLAKVDAMLGRGSAASGAQAA